MDNKGFTLIEVILTMSLSLIIILILYSVFLPQQKRLTQENQKILRNRILRLTIDKFTDALLNSGVNPNGTLTLGTTVGITSATATSITILADLNGDGDTDDTSESLVFSYNSGTQMVSRSGIDFADQITALTLTYYDSTGAAMAVPVAAGNLNQITKVNVSVTARTSAEFSNKTTGYNLVGTAADGTCPTSTLSTSILIKNTEI